MAPYAIIAGFTCTEGQGVAYLKELGVSGAALAALIFTVAALSQKWHTRSRLNKIMRLLGMLAVGVVAVAIMLVGPFFYSSWGCTTIIQSLFGY